MDDPILINRTAAFKEMLEDLKRQTLLAVDTESNSLFAYQEQVCLIQFSTEDRDYLVDTLALRDLSPLKKIFFDPAIEKIFHAAEYDLICLNRDYGFEFQNLFDTMLASRILGREAVGLGSILKEEFQIKVNKRFQKANWGKRPLPKEFMNYARLDTHFLIPLRNMLKKELLDTDRWGLAQEDFIRACDVSLPTVENGVHLCWRVAGRNSLSDMQMAVLQSLCQHRDQKAKERNRPTFKIIGNDALLKIALAVPKSREELYQVEGISMRLIDRHRVWLVQAVQEGLKNKPIKRQNNHSKRPDEAALDRLDKLRNWRKNTAIGIGVPSDVVMPKDILYKIASGNPTSLTELEELMNTIPWRFNRFGTQILELIQN